ncbi:MAG: hypothetical protein WD378_00600, partial [Egicoccus sp.]
RDPQSMVNALRRLEADKTEIKKFEVATAHLWFEEPNETKGKDRAAKMARRFATHPSINERIERLARLNAGTVRLDAPLPPPAHGGEPDPPPGGQQGAGGAFGPLHLPGMPDGFPGSPPPPPPPPGS